MIPGDVPAKIDAVATLLERHGDDPMTVDAALSGLAGSEHVVLGRLLQNTSASPQRSAAITTLAATIVRGGQDAPFQEVLRLAAQTDRAEWQRTALFQGAEAALLNGSLPGTGRRGGGAAAAQGTGAGQRGGPGGAPAFPTTPNPAAAGGGGRGRGNAVAAVPLQREPAELVKLAASPGEDGNRAKALLARLTWPGKPVAAGAAPAAAPLTAEEQKRFDEGKTVYTNLCVACHQEDGRGREKLAPSLVGSNFALGPSGVPIRILLNGKEGPVGLMPPLGAALSDAQIAGVLTFVRRSWGHQDTAVDEAAVGAVRKATTGRAKPWSEAELSTIK